MKTAWVITQEGTQHETEVVGILSARKSENVVKQHVEWLYALLHYGPAEHVSLAQYNSPSNPYEAQFMTTNTGVPVQNTMMCGHNPYLVARLAKNVTLIDSDSDQPRLKWANPDRIVCDTDTLRVIERVPGGTCEAPVRLPLRRD
jgi:hypothetical protein